MSDPPRSRGAFARALLLRLVPSAIALAAVLHLVASKDVWQHARAAQWAVLLPALALNVAAGCVVGLRWRRTLHLAGIAPPPAARAILLTLRAQAALPLLPGGLGADVLRFTELGVARTQWAAFASAGIAERLAATAVLAILGGSAAVAALLGGPAGGAAAVVCTAVLFGACAAVAPWAARRSSVFLAVLTERRILLWSYLSQSLALAAFALALRAGGLRAGAPATLLAAACSAFTGMLPIALNGYGLREAALLALAPALGMDAAGVVAASLVGASGLLVGLIAIGLALRAMPLSRAGRRV